MCAWVCRRIPRSALVFSSPLQILLKERVFRLGLLLGLWLAARLAFLFVLFVICSGRGKRVGNLARPTTHLFFFFFLLSFKPTHPLWALGVEEVAVPGSFQSGRRPEEVARPSAGAAQTKRLVPRPAASYCLALGGPAPGAQDWKVVPPVSRGDVWQGMPGMCVSLV